MFGIFKKKPEYSLEDICDQLGVLAKHINYTASEGSDLKAVLKRAALISAVITESKKFFALEVKPNTIFARYLIALQEHDISKMEEMTKNMADALNKVSEIRLKGTLIYFWFNGNE